MRDPDRRFDLVVIGGGSAGGSAARRARAEGHSVAVVEKDKVGGDCPNYACVPTKALLHSAKVYSLLRRGAEFGLRCGSVDFDWAQVMARKDEIVHAARSRGAPNDVVGALGQLPHNEFDSSDQVLEEYPKQP